MKVSSKVVLSALVSGGLFYWWSTSAPCYFICIESGFSVPFIVYRSNMGTVQKRRIRNLNSSVYLSPVNTHVHFV